MRVIIVEDEAPARLKLEMQLQNIEGVVVVAECSDPLKAIEDINTLKPDVVLLDIELGELSGFDVLEALNHPCHIIFTTAFNQYAVKAFEKRAIDYLLKPFSLDRLRQALERVVIPHSADSDQSGEKTNKQLVAKAGDKMHVLQTEDICFVKISQGMVVARSTDREYYLDGSLELVLQQLPRSFLRVHRRCIVNTTLISQIEKWQNGAFLLRFNEISETVTTSRRGSLAIKKQFNI